MSVTDSWTCPLCQATWNRQNQTREDWTAALRRVQAAHGASHKKGPRS